MKKLLTLLLSLSILLSLCACTAAQDEQPTAEAPQPSEQAQLPPDDAASALALLEDVWNSYSRENRFPITGGDFSEENMTQDAPGKYSLEDPAALESTFALPAAQVAQIDDAASIIHMMNANTFTCGAFHLISAEERDGFAEALKTAVLSRQWMCGFPETLLLVGVGNYVISVFGNDELVQIFKTQLLSVFASAQILTEEAITF